jgi:hypothetical protein
VHAMIMGPALQRPSAKFGAVIDEEHLRISPPSIRPYAPPSWLTLISRSASPSSTAFPASPKSPRRS